MMTRRDPESNQSLWQEAVGCDVALVVAVATTIVLLTTGWWLPSGFPIRGQTAV